MSGKRSVTTLKKGNELVITVVSGWVEWSYRIGGYQTTFGRTYGRGNIGENANQYRAVVGMFQLEAHNTKIPVWRLVSRQNGMTYANRLGADIDLDCRKSAAKTSFTLATSDYAWIDGLFPNKALVKGEVVQMFPECKEMPHPYCLDYARDRA